MRTNFQGLQGRADSNESLELTGTDSRVCGVMTASVFFWKMKSSTKGCCEGGGVGDPQVVDLCEW